MWTSCTTLSSGWKLFWMPALMIAPVYFLLGATYGRLCTISFWILIAAFAMKAPNDFKYKYIIFFHGSVDVFPETHGNATLASAFTNDFKKFYYDL